jgi:serine/threonine protein kinase
VIHGDVKPQNVLVYETPYRAKGADFGHSLFNTGETRKLIGGTKGYAAPEWMLSASTEMLKQTDVFSYGLVFTSIMLGTDVLDWFAKNHGGMKAGLKFLDDLKNENTILQHLSGAIQQLDDPTLEDSGLILDVLRCTLQNDPKKRSLQDVISRLSSP